MFFKWRGYYLWEGRPKRYTHADIQPDDILILATDGVLDNLFVKDLVRLVETRGLTNLQTPKQVQNMAKKIAEDSFRLSNEADYRSPFTVAAEGVDDKPEMWRTTDPKHRPNRDGRCLGGKRDDITVVVARLDIKNP